MIPTIALLHTVALAEQPTERNLAATNLGVQYWNAPALKAAALAPGDIDGDGIPNDQDPDSKNFSDLDVIFGQRIRWTLSDNGSTAVRLRVNGQFTYSPGELGGSPAWKRNRVRQLGVSIVNDKVNVDIGRSQVHKGGPRLVDGLQVVAHVNNTTDVGAWAGLQPDLFTTDPRMRPGAGPILAYAASRVQASAVGEVVFGGGGLDRMGALLQARASAARTVDVAVRADVDLAGGPRLEDGQLFVRWSPVDTLSIDALYNVFSSFLYQNTQNLDPDLQRFGQRIVSVGNEDYLPALYQDCMDPGIAQMAGMDFRLRPDGEATGLVAKLSARYRFGNNAPPLPDAGTPPQCILADTNSYVRVSPRIGVANLGVGGGLDISLDANVYNIEGHGQSDAGLTIYFEPKDEGLFAIDTSYRMLFNKYDAQKNPDGYSGTGHYADLFVDVVVEPADMMLGIGLNFESEPGVQADGATTFNEGALGGFLRATKYFRPSK